MFKFTLAPGDAGLQGTPGLVYFQGVWETETVAAVVQSHEILSGYHVWVSMVTVPDH